MSFRFSDSDPAKTGRPVRRLLPWLLVAFLLLSSGWFALQNFALKALNADLESQKRLAEITAAMSQTQLSERSLIAEKIINDLGRKSQHNESLSRLEISVLSGNSPSLRNTFAAIAWDPTQKRGVLVAENLPPLASAKVYQLWVNTPASPEAVLNLGTFRPDTANRTTRFIFQMNPDVAPGAPTEFFLSIEEEPHASRPLSGFLLSSRSR